MSSQRQPTERRSTIRFDAAELTGLESYKLLTGLVVPRPIGWIGTVSAAGVSNLAPYSFFNAVSGRPPMLVFSPGRGSRKDTLANVRVVPEFTVNVVTIEVVEAMNLTAAPLASGKSEFDLAGLVEVPSTLIRPPRVAECKAAMECVVTDIVEIGDPAEGNALVIGEVVVFHVAEELLDGTRIDQSELAAVGRHAGNWYSNATDLFELIRPT